MNRPATGSYSLRVFSSVYVFKKSTKKGSILGSIVSSCIISTVYMYITVKLRNNKELFRRKMKSQS